MILMVFVMVIALAAAVAAAVVAPKLARIVNKILLLMDLNAVIQRGMNTDLLALN